MSDDNERDRFVNGFDAGVIVDGEIVYDDMTKRYVIMDDEGVVFDPQEAMKSLNGKKMRMTMVSFDAMIEMEEMMNKAEENKLKASILIQDKKIN